MKFKVWVVVEEVDEQGDTVRNCDMPGASVATFEIETDAIRFAVELQAHGQKLNKV